MCASEPVACICLIRLLRARYPARAGTWQRLCQGAGGGQGGGECAQAVWPVFGGARAAGGREGCSRGGHPPGGRARCHVRVCAFGDASLAGCVLTEQVLSTSCSKTSGQPPSSRRCWRTHRSGPRPMLRWRWVLACRQAQGWCGEGMWMALHAHGRMHVMLLYESALPCGAGCRCGQPRRRQPFAQALSRCSAMSSAGVPQCACVCAGNRWSDRALACEG